MRNSGLSYYEVASRFVRGQEGSSKTRPGHGPRMYTDGKTVWSYGTHFPIARHEGTWLLPENKIQVVSCVNYASTSTTNKHISKVKKQLGFWRNSKENTSKLLVVYHDLRNNQTVQEGAKKICSDSLSRIVRAMIRYNRCQRDWTRRGCMYWAEFYLHQLEAAEWILGKRTEISRVSPPDYQSQEIPPWELLMSLVDYISPHLDLPLDLSKSLPSLYKKVRLHSQRKVLVRFGLSPNLASLKSASTKKAPTGAPTVQTGSQTPQCNSPKTTESKSDAETAGI